MDCNFRVWVSLALILLKDTPDTQQISVPVLNNAGVPNNMTVHVKYIGSAFDALRWVPVRAEPLPKAAATSFLIISMFKAYVSQDTWILQARAFRKSVRGWLLDRRLPQEALVAVFGFNKISDVSAFNCNVRVHKAAADRVSAASGQAGFLCK